MWNLIAMGKLLEKELTLEIKKSGGMRDCDWEEVVKRSSPPAVCSESGCEVQTPNYGGSVST